MKTKAPITKIEYVVARQQMKEETWNKRWPNGRFGISHGCRGLNPNECELIWEGQANVRSYSRGGIVVSSGFSRRPYHAGLFSGRFEVYRTRRGFSPTTTAKTLERFVIACRKKGIPEDHIAEFVAAYTTHQTTS